MKKILSELHLPLKKKSTPFFSYVKGKDGQVAKIEHYNGVCDGKVALKNFNSTF